MTIYILNTSLRFTWMNIELPFFSIKILKRDPRDGALYRKNLVIDLFYNLRIELEWDRDYSIDAVGPKYSFSSILAKTIIVGLFLAYLYFKFS